MGSTIDQGSYRLQLRQDTHAHHQILNRHPLLKGLTKPSYPLTHYKVLLLAYSVLYRQIEELIERFLISQHVDFDYSERRKSAWLVKGLAYFHDHNIGLDATFNAFVASTLAIPNLGAVSELAGLLYVIEGSTLGGQHISRALADYHGLSSETGASFFNGYGQHTLMRWESFLQFFDSVIQDNEDFLSAKDVACRVFQTFQSALDYGVPFLPES